MHELSIAMSIIEMAEEEAERRGGVQVLAVHLKLGDLSGVVKEALLSSYEMASEESVLKGSRLLIETLMQAAGVCRDERIVFSSTSRRTGDQSAGTSMTPVHQPLGHAANAHPVCRS